MGFFFNVILFVIIIIFKCNIFSFSASFLFIWQFCFLFYIIVNQFCYLLLFGFDTILLYFVTKQEAHSVGVSCIAFRNLIWFMLVADKCMMFYLPVCIYLIVFTWLCLPKSIELGADMYSLFLNIMSYQVACGTTYLSHLVLQYFIMEINYSEYQLLLMLLAYYCIMYGYICPYISNCIWFMSLVQ
jgi:hypothetical protein